MKKLFLITALGMAMLTFAQISPSNVSNPINSINMQTGHNRSITWPTSVWGNGFGHRIVSHDPGGLTFLNFQSRHNTATWSTSLTISSQGKVGIGTQNPTELFTVNGKILCEEVEVIADVLPDYVFQKYYTGYSVLNPDYNMPTLLELEAYLKQNHHLPDVPSAEEVKEDGLGLKEMTTILLQKVEELTLYTIEQEKRIKALEAELAKKQ